MLAVAKCQDFKAPIRAFLLKEYIFWQIFYLFVSLITCVWEIVTRSTCKALKDPAVFAQMIGGYCMTTDR